MSTPTLGPHKGGARDLYFFTHPERWPTWPLLPESIGAFRMAMMPENAVVAKLIFGSCVSMHALTNPKREMLVLLAVANESGMVCQSKVVVPARLIVPFELVLQ